MGGAAGSRGRSGLPGPLLRAAAAPSPDPEVPAAGWVAGRGRRCQPKQAQLPLRGPVCREGASRQEYFYPGGRRRREEPGGAGLPRVAWSGPVPAPARGP